MAGTPMHVGAISVRDEAMKREAVAFADVKGAFIIAALNDGIYRVDVTLAGFRPARMEHLELKAGEVIHASVALRMDTSEMITVGGLAPMNMEAGTTTISQDILRKLPF